MNFGEAKSAQCLTAEGILLLLFIEKVSLSCVHELFIPSNRTSRSEVVNLNGVNTSYKEI